MRRLFAITLFLLTSLFSFAQDKPLIAEGTSPDLFITHKVQPKENYYSIGRLYNASPKAIAPYNKLEFEKALSPGQVIKIPLTETNFTQTGEAASGEVIVPLHHTVEPKEVLYRISVRYNKVPLDILKKWNKLSSDAVSNGTRLVVGYLKVSEEQSPLAKKGTKASPVTTEVVTKPKVEEEKVVTETKPNTEQQKPQTETEKTQVEKPALAEKQIPQTEIVSMPSGLNFNGGVFKKLFDNQSENKLLAKETGAAGVFKSTSGWQDGKYYCLHNLARPETIIKVTNETTGKSIYAKVLDMIPDIKQNTGSVILISNAAAEELGAGEGKFAVNISYNR